MVLYSCGMASPWHARHVRARLTSRESPSSDWMVRACPATIESTSPFSLGPLNICTVWLNLVPVQCRLHRLTSPEKEITLLHTATRIRTLRVAVWKRLHLHVGDGADARTMVLSTNAVTFLHVDKSAYIVCMEVV